MNSHPCLLWSSTEASGSGGQRWKSQEWEECWVITLSRFKLREEMKSRVGKDRCMALHSA